MIELSPDSNWVRWLALPLIWAEQWLIKLMNLLRI